MFERCVSILTASNARVSRFAGWWLTLQLIVASTALASSAMSTKASATPLVDEPTISREHRMNVKGQVLAYTSTVGRLPVRTAGTDEVRARMFFVAYRMKPAVGTTRPLTVIWNGGPGGSVSSILLGGQGPKRIAAGEVVDNPETILGDTDLLYIDAVGAGFSRPATRKDEDVLYSTTGDVEAFVDCVLGWRRLLGTPEQPILLAGVSWGAFRVAAVAHALTLRGANVIGGVMMAGRNGLAKAGSERRFLPLGVVHYPRVAHHHGIGPKRSSRELDRLEDHILTWATSEYLPALSNLSSLSSAQKEAIVARLAAYSFVPANKIDRRTLVVTPRQFTSKLLEKKGLTLLQYDMRRTSSTQLNSGTEPGVARIRPSAGERYLRTELGYSTSLAYLPLIWDALGREGFTPAGSQPPDWDYLNGYYADKESNEQRANSNAQAEIAGYAPGGQEQPLAQEAMRLVPAMRFVVIHGRYDALPSSCASVQQQLAEIDPVIQRRVTFRCVDGGHSLFVGDPQILRLINADFKALILGKSNERADRIAGLLH